MVSTARVRTRGPSDNWILLGQKGTTLGTTDFYTKSPYHERVVDNLHDWPPDRRYVRDVGGAFFLTKARYNRGITAPVYMTGAAGRTWSGSFTDSYFGHPAIPAVPVALTDNQMAAYGAIGWNRHKPGRPLVDVGQFIGELRQLPSLPLKIGAHLRTALTGKSRSKDYMNLGSEYLNVEFGWKPFIKDVIDMLSFNSKIDARLAQLKRDNGKQVRRKGSVSGSESTSITQGTGYLYPSLTNDFHPTSLTGDMTVTTTISTKVSFAAGFRYWIPNIDSPAKQRELVRQMLGLRLTPGLLWELTPWSWLIDWFSSIGPVLDNMSGNAAENLAANYAYVMAHRINNVSVQESNDFTVGTLSVSSFYEREAKQRMAASPFGFGLTSTDISVKQKLILGALGISRNWSR